MQAKELVLDRIEQSFELFKNNFQTLFIPMFLYSFISTIFTVFITYFGIKKVQELLSQQDMSGMDFYDILYNTQTQIMILIGILLLLAYLILYIPFILGLIKSISQAYNWETPHWKDNLKYWFSNLWNSFKTYWYIFAYVALIPAIGFIIGWVTMLYWMQYNQEIFTTIGWAIAWFSLLLFLVFSIYRWTKSAFWIHSAVGHNNYSLENFKQSVSITKNKVWRIIWNLMLIWFIWWLVVWMIQWVVDSFGSSFGIWAETFFSNINSKNENPQEDIRLALSEIINSYSPVANIITNILQWIIKTIFSIFIIVFTYILFKRLELENWDKKDEKIVEL